MPTRPIYWNIEGHAFLYVLLIAAAAVAAYGIYRRYQLWRIGQPVALKLDVKRGLNDLWTNVVLQRRLLQEKAQGLSHMSLLFGCGFFLLSTATIALQADVGLPVYQGAWFLFLKFTANVFGVLGIVGLCYFLYRRLVAHTAQLSEEKDDILFPVALLAVFVTGFLMEGMRMATMPAAWDWASFPGAALATLFAGMDAAALGTAYAVLWWFHAAVVMAMIAAIPYTKVFHILLMPVNIFLRPVGTPGVMMPIDFEDESIETYGKAAITEFSQKTLFDSDVCVRCGRCEALCPAHRSGKALSPKAVTQTFRQQMEETGGKLLAAAKAKAHTAEAAAAGAAEEDDEEGSGFFLSPEEIWSCTTCRSCEAQCPGYIGHVDRILEMRRHAVLMEEPFPEEAQLAFRNLENNGNPWGIGSAKRAEFLETLGVPTIEDAPDAEYIFWPGCFGSFDARSQKITIATVKLLKAAGVNFAVLGGEETCCGDSARRLGNEYLFSMLAEQNIELMNDAGVKKIITTCPHCYHVLKEEYPAMGGSYEVIHHTEFLAALVREGKLPIGKLASLAGKTAVYHDSCYLGRYQGIYDAPRALVSDLGLTVSEMEHNHAKSLCCGAGGGRMWLEETEGQKMNVLRAEEATAAGADCVVTACPFCLTMFADGLKAVDGGASVKAYDIAELLAEALPASAAGTSSDTPEAPEAAEATKAAS